jgi:hypothetical protein
MYDFLTDGARAVKAFSRPYPFATVGVVEDMKFDLEKADFEMTICVRGEDRPVVLPKTEMLKDSLKDSPSAASAVVMEMEAGMAPSIVGDSPLSELPTEIFIPVIHYASPALLSRSVFAKSEVPQEQEVDELCPRVASSSGSRSSSPGASTPTTPTVEYVSNPMTLSTTTLPKPTPLVDITVEVSAGRWEIEGQTLRWWHPIPRSDDAEEMQHRIRITRAMGPIKAKNDGRRRSEEGEGGATSGVWNMCEKMCPSEACVIM